MICGCTQVFNNLWASDALLCLGCGEMGEGDPISGFSVERRYDTESEARDT